jgi:uncharacterized protein YdeI (BOF family)
MKQTSTAFAAVFILSVLTGCGKTAETTMGVKPAASVSVVSVNELAKTPKTKPVSIKGEMIEKCPVAGCWFVLKDNTGTVRVDTKAAGFVVTDVPLHTTMTVSGTVTPGSQPGLAATGLRY